MNSMTGFGRTTAKCNGVVLDIEIRSVNHRFLNIKYDLPYQFSQYEGEIEKLIKGCIKRGSVTVNVSIKPSQKDAQNNVINTKAIQDYYKKLNKIKKRLGIKGDIPFEAVISIPQIWNFNNKLSTADKQIPWNSVKGCLSKALAALLKMRGKEGVAVRTDFLKRLSSIKEFAYNVEKRAPAVIANYQKRLDNRINDLVRSKGLEMSKADTSKELAVFAERCDINEELQRLLSHIEQFTAVLDAEGEIGRRLDFITQEMAREANTLASKGNDYLVSKYAVDIKVEIEKLKELVENIE